MTDGTTVNRKRILIVDDNVDLTITDNWLLSEGDFDVVIANSGTECLAVLETFTPDVVFVDIGMPHMSGIELCRRLRSHPNSAAARLIARTGYADEAMQAKAKEAGFDDFLAKPFDLRTFMDVLTSNRSNA